MGTRPISHFIKICGIRDAKTARNVASLGPDAIGVVLSESPRRVSVDIANEIAMVVGSEIPVIGVFMGAEDEFSNIVARLHLDGFQLYSRGNLETASAVLRANQILLAAGPLKSKNLLVEGLRHVNAFLAEAGQPGTGAAWEWSRGTSEEQEIPFILAGGLGPENVADAIRKVVPQGVDVSSGVESSLGVKDMERVERFIAEARGAFERGKL